MNSDEKRFEQSTKEFFEEPERLARSRYALQRIYREIENLLNLHQGKTLLDIGCGPGNFLTSLNRNNMFKVGIDFALRPLREAIAKDSSIRTCQASALQLPFSASSFDMVVCFNVLHHVEDPNRVIEEVWRVLKSDGFFCALEPNILSPYQILHCIHHPILEKNIRHFHTFYLKKIMGNSPFRKCAIRRINIVPTFFNNPTAYRFYDYVERRFSTSVLNWFAMHHFVVARKSNA